MPRGVYDRSKMKNKNTKATKSTETVVHAAPAKKGPKGPRGRKAKGAGGNIAQGAFASHTAQSSTGRADGNQFFLFDQVRQNLNTLTALKQQFSDIPTIRTEVEAHLEVLSDLRQQAFPKQAEEKTVAAPSNGVTATTMPSVVPMPPSVPTIPTTH